MNKCAVCGDETELFRGKSPICADCVAKAAELRRFERTQLDHSRIDPRTRPAKKRVSPEVPVNKQFVPFGMDVSGTLSGKRFRLDRDALAVETVNGQRPAIKIPRGVIIKVASGTVKDNGMLDVFWDSRLLAMFAVDVTLRGTEITE